MKMIRVLDQGGDGSSPELGENWDEKVCGSSGQAGEMSSL